MERTYKSWQDWDFESKQIEITEPTELLDEKGNLQTAGWARRNVFTYDRDRVKHPLRRKEWDFYQISNGRYMAQVNFANISLGGYASAMLVDLKSGEVLANEMGPFIGGKDKYILPAKGDVPNEVSFHVGGADFYEKSTTDHRTLDFKNDDVKCHFEMEIPEGLENITTVLPFDKKPDRYFMTTKQNCMPTEGTFLIKNETYTFSKENTFCVMDWGRVCTPYSLVWYWGNGSSYITTEDGEKHLFGFEITWGIGNEKNATETCMFFDGKAHKFGPVDVETFPKPDGYMNPWKFISKDGRFDLTMTPTLDHHSDLNVYVMRMHSHQVHGLWNGTVTLDDSRVIKIKDMYAFCEYVENRW